MPESIPYFLGMWADVKSAIQSGIFAVNKEIYDELCLCLVPLVHVCRIMKTICFLK